MFWARKWWHLKLWNVSANCQLSRGSSPKHCVEDSGPGINRCAKSCSHFMYHMLSGPHTLIPDKLADRSSAYTPSSIYTFVEQTATRLHGWNKSLLIKHWHLSSLFISLFLFVVCRKVSGVSKDPKRGLFILSFLNQYGEYLIKRRAALLSETLLQICWGLAWSVFCSILPHIRVCTCLSRLTC